MARLPPNVEKSAFRRGQYVIHAGDGNIWYGIKQAVGWRAAPGPNNPARYSFKTVRAGTLTSLAALLSARTVQPTTLDTCAFTTV